MRPACLTYLVDNKIIIIHTERELHIQRSKVPKKIFERFNMETGQGDKPDCPGTDILSSRDFVPHN